LHEFVPCFGNSRISGRADLGFWGQTVALGTSKQRICYCGDMSWIAALILVIVPPNHPRATYSAIAAIFTGVVRSKCSVAGFLSPF
jgi:hypothetical protein